MSTKLVRFYCSKIGKPFDAMIVTSGRDRYRFSHTQKRRGLPGTAPDTDLTGQKNSEIDASLVDWTNFACAWCGATRCEGSLFVQCGSCGELICSATNTRAAQGVRFTCRPACGTSGYISGHIESYDAQTGQPQIGHDKRDQVSDGRSGQLPPPPKTLAPPPTGLPWLK